MKRMPAGQEVFALPAYQSMPFAVFLQALRSPQGQEIAYAQSQNNRHALHYMPSMQMQRRKFTCSRGAQPMQKSRIVTAKFHKDRSVSVMCIYSLFG